LAVSKTRTADEVARLADQGQRHFGENYLQEALDKIAALQGKELVWHFIGPIQSNKTRDIAAHFDWVHSVDRLKVARRLSDQRPTGLAPLNVCIQVNVDDEDSKSGIPLDAVPALAEQIAALPNLRLRGLMAIPLANSEDNSRGAFRQLAMTLSQLRNTMPSL
ncbi:YggS family pyridoxal phosphate enzyme, partial [Alcanivorax sp. HI0013]